MLLKHAWIAWLKGFPDFCENDENNAISKPVEPLRNIKPTMLPRKLSEQFRTSILPIMKLIESAPEIAITSATLITNEFVNESFWHGTNHVKSIVSYVFQNENWSKWKTSYFCNMIKHTTIMKRGTLSDKQRAEASKTNYSNKKQRRR